MKFNKVIMNPPYSGNLHLRILEKIINICNPQDGCEIVNLSPVRWYQDPLANKKNNSDYKKFKLSIVDNLHDLKFISINDAATLFNIGAPSDLGIYRLNNRPVEIRAYPQLCYNIINKILSHNNCTLAKKIEAEQLLGWRVEIKKEVQEGNHNAGNAESSKKAPVNICLGPYKDGYDETNTFWSMTRTKNQHTREVGSPFRFSIKFDNKQLANNFINSCNCNFYKNFIHLLKTDINIPLKFAPYMEDYSHVWTDEDYCKFFGLNEEESKFMCRTVDDYRVKDFINYEEF